MLRLNNSRLNNSLEEASVVDRHRCSTAAKFGAFVDKDHAKLPTPNWLPNQVLLLIHVRILY